MLEESEGAMEVETTLLIALAGVAGGAMNALAGGGTFATLPALLAVGVPANVANATSNVALLPGAATSTWAFRGELGPLGGVDHRVLAGITFVGGLVGSALLVVTPGHAFDLIVPWLVLYAFVVLAFGRHASAWLAARVTIGARTLVAVQALLGVYGGYFGGGVGLMTTATYGLLASITPRAMFGPRTLMLAVANAAAAIVFVSAGMVEWRYAVPMLVGAVVGGWGGAAVGRHLPELMVRTGTLAVTGVTAALFFWRAYG